MYTLCNRLTWYAAEFQAVLYNYPENVRIGFNGLRYDVEIIKPEQLFTGSFVELLCLHL